MLENTSESDYHSPSQSGPVVTEDEQLTNSDDVLSQVREQLNIQQYGDYEAIHANVSKILQEGYQQLEAIEEATNQELSQTNLEDLPKTARQIRRENLTLIDEYHAKYGVLLSELRLWSGRSSTDKDTLSEAVRFLNMYWSERVDPLFNDSRRLFEEAVMINMSESSDDDKQKRSFLLVREQSINRELNEKLQGLLSEVKTSVSECPTCGASVVSLHNWCGNCGTEVDKNIFKRRTD